MTYDPEVPQPDDDMSDSQADLLTNNQDLATVFAVNHVALDDASADKGKHKYVTYVQQSDDPETAANEYAVYSKDDGGDTELFARPENNGTAFQLTRDGSLYLGIIPFAAVNFSIGPITLQNAFGVQSVTQPGSAGRYRVNFTAAATALLNGSNDYLWSVSGFANSTDPVIAQVTNTTAYNTVVTDTYIQFDFKNQSNSLVGTLTRASVICWRFQ